MLKVRLLTIEELRKYQTQKTTDFAYLTGAHQNQKSLNENLVDSPRFSSTTNGYGWVCSVYPNGQKVNQSQRINHLQKKEKTKRN